MHNAPMDSNRSVSDRKGLSYRHRRQTHNWTLGDRKEQRLSQAKPSPQRFVSAHLARPRWQLGRPLLQRLFAFENGSNVVFAADCWCQFSQECGLPQSPPLPSLQFTLHATALPLRPCFLCELPLQGFKLVRVHLRLQSPKRVCARACTRAREGAT
eukprot:140236-Pleurochrysis_carterae.AAC.1